MDPTLRDPMENGMETTRAKFTRRRRSWTVSVDMITNADWTTLEDFVVNTAVYGANIFLFPDNRDAANPVTLQVRFSVIPAYTDAGSIEGEFRQNCTFELREP